MTQPPPCCFCGAASTKWSGRDYWQIKPLRNVGLLFCCAACDPSGKWSDYAGEPIERDEEGRWRNVLREEEEA